MKARVILLILFIFFTSLLLVLCPLSVVRSPAFAQEVKKIEELTSGKPYYDLKKDSFDHWERTKHLRNNMDHLQTFPFINRPAMQLDLGPAQFKLTIPFR